QTESVQENALRLVSELNAGNYENAYREFQYERTMKFSLGAGAFKDLWTDLTDEYGQPREILSSTVNTVGKDTTVSVIVQHEKAQVIVNVIYNSNNRISGLEYGIVEEDVDWEQTGENDPSLAPNETLLSVGTDQFPLKAMLSIPLEGTKPYPLVILVPGSGPNDMDETVGVCTPFKDIAEQLNKNGIAVLRFNSRAYEYLDEIGKNIANFTPYEEIIEDAVAVYHDAKTLYDIDPDRIYIAGHSIGGYFIPRIAEYTPDAAGYILLAANAYHMEDLIYQQYRYLVHMDGKVKFAEKFVLARYQNMTKRVKNLKEGDDVNPRKLYGVYPNYWLYANKYNVLETVKKIDLPVLFLQGTRDYQVSIDNFKLWKQTMEGKDNAQFIQYDNLNHLF
ncbi:MAG TPA: hypothetical protein DDZ89_08900, partial [Clostridiales bacterium]|nr:hypothetical protein [Clostridiales bacterium]